MKNQYIKGNYALCNNLCSSSPSSCFSAIWNIGEFEAKKYFIDHQTANAIQLFFPIKRKFFRSILFQSKSQRRGISQGLLYIQLKKPIRKNFAIFAGKHVCWSLFWDEAEIKWKVVRPATSLKRDSNADVFLSIYIPMNI